MKSGVQRQFRHHLMFYTAPPDGLQVFRVIVDSGSG
jgi:hypothetical protein